MVAQIKLIMKGKFITLYGINNIGKSTQARILVKRLEEAGYKTKYLKYPVYDLKPSGPIINKILRSKKQKVSEQELQLWFVLNRHQFEPKLRKWLEDGYIVIAEDYTGTGIAWGTAKGLEQNWLEETNRFLLREDFAILMEGKRDARVIEKYHVHEQNADLISRCEAVLKKLKRRYKWHNLKVEMNIEKTADKIFSMVEDFLKQV